MGGYISQQPGDPKRSAIIVTCTGDAHSNAHIDNCMSCSPNWGYYFACPSCTGKLDPKGFCRNGECVCGGDRFILPR